MWYCVTGWAVPDILKDSGALYFSVKQSAKNFFLDCLTLKMEASQPFATVGTTHPTTQYHIPEPPTQQHSIISHSHPPNNTVSYPRTTHPTTQYHIPEPPTQQHSIISQNHPPNDTVSYPKVLDSSTSNKFAYWNKTNKVTLSKCISLLIACYLHRKLSVGCKAQHSITQLQTMQFSSSCIAVLSQWC